MLRKFKVTVDGQPYAVTVEEVADDSGLAYQDTAALNRQAAPPPPPAGPTAVGPGDIVSPLAGVVISIDVATGDGAGAKTQIAVIEAMKMKTVIIAHRVGKVSAIAVEPGDRVVAEQVLMTVD